ncbi:MAG: PspC domain-containing protein [Paludibacteraceae bacterium]|nr:PspC domain-containing protein [Paludibacteraceae bacterium]
MMAAKKLTRSNNKVLAGVCGGIAEYFEIDPTLVRVCYAALSLLTTGFPGVILYIIMLLLMPLPPKDYEQLD